MDRLSELPDSTVHHILSYLTAKEAARTSILSTRWKGLYTSFPVLDFHDSYTYFMEQDLATINPAMFYHSNLEKVIEIFRERVSRFIEFVDDFLLRFCQFELCMQKFRLLIGLLDVEGSSAILDRWIGLAIEKKVEELDFNILAHRRTLYNLPQTLFSSGESVTALKLGGCKLEQVPSDAPMRLHSLKSLTLKEACIKEEILHKFISQCPSLEDLFLLDCWGFRDICVSDACKLKIMSIRESYNELQSIKVAVSSLQQFILGSEYPRGPIVIDMDGCPNLKVLQLSNVAFTDQEFHRLISKFPLLEDLNVGNCDLLERIAISSLLLKRLSIGLCFSLKEIDVDTPNLLSFCYDNYPIPVALINAPCPWKVGFVTQVWGTDTSDTRWYLNMKEFLGASNQIEYLSFYGHGNKNSFSFDEFRKSSPSPPCEVGNLYLQLEEPSLNYAVFLDGVLGICYPKTLSVAKSYATNRTSIKWLYDILINREANCCDFHDIKCWRHYLKDVKVGSFIPCKDKNPVHMDNLIDAVPELPDGTFCFHLDWCLPIPMQKA
ncbi:hypothetical protein JRO89_XS09G0168400 [Xanthoceras sorbifolium]|uniref:F-box domain-containing protein n=1 Tax=Xanthoceras sorbifolium TaxID=99658 RepID=A0ABQ8HLM9_9ROSI|nr:hypothetical protein JRO89_XS09G0168400 [Xanthoceras sorbifolium]